MKKFLIFTFTIASMLWAQNAMAWSNLPHGTIAYIAEQHLTPEAKAKCYHYLRHTLPFYASWMDRWRGSAIFEDVNNAHSGTAMADGVNYDFKSGKPAGKVMGHLVNALAELGDGKYKNLPDSVVRQRLINMVHYVGDMHCPTHNNFSKEHFPQYRYSLSKNGKKYNFHTFWDGSLGSFERRKWTYEKFAAKIDTYSPEEIQKIQGGTLEDWGRELVQFGHRARKITPKDTDVAKLTKEQKKEVYALADEAAVKGAYRLAHILNTIFSDKNIQVFNK